MKSIKRITKLLRKFRCLLKNYILGALEYRGEIITGLLMSLLELALSIFLWSAVIKSSGSIGGYDFNSIVVYFLITRLISPFTKSKTAKEIGKIVQDGKLSGPLLKPFAVPTMFIAKALSKGITEGMIGLIVFSIPFLFMPDLLGALKLSVVNIAAFVLMIMLAFAFVSSFYFIIGCFSFWMVRIDGLRHSIGLSVDVLRGGWFPISIAPMWFQKISAVLPFSYLAYYPIRILTEGLNAMEFARGCIILLVSTIICSIIAAILWKRGLYKYTGVGI